jgi:hypothetical protein
MNSNNFYYNSIILERERAPNFQQKIATMNIGMCSRNLGSCEYKYVVRNTDGSVDTWTPGGNFALQLPPHPEDSRGVGVPEKVEVSDAWDSSSRKIKVPPPPLSPCSQILMLLGSGLDELVFARRDPALMI